MFQDVRLPIRIVAAVAVALLTAGAAHGQEATDATDGPPNILVI
jgi:hypothetical protein